MPVSPVTSSTASAATPPATASQAAGAAKSLSGTYDSFLKLLTTQLQHQDPLSPMDSNQFISQLVAFAGVEQQINSNSNLEKLIGLQNNNLTTSALGYIGKTVQAAGDTTALAGGQAQFGYNLAGTAAAVDLAVLDPSGHVVYATTGETAQGNHTFTWDGHDMNGNALPDGSYTLRVVAQNAQGGQVAATTTVFGKVTGVANDDTGLSLLVGATKIPVASVTGVTGP
jgi:flagellar basal-body rod modification protein FlgD